MKAHHMDHHFPNCAWDKQFGTNLGYDETIGRRYPRYSNWVAGLYPPVGSGCRDAVPADR